ncbi:acyl-CoA N-acyltransferase [Aspergillus egyptiacus]|nr:acyl-CoA N-acyltransferase [Aspergillus egyptiacus]
MKYDTCLLPNGIQVSVTPIFGGFKFNVKDHEQYSSFSPEWMVCMCTKHHRDSHSSEAETAESKPFTNPSLAGDTLYLSALSLPSCKDLKPSSAPARQVAMVLWATFLWYFQEPEPKPPEGPHELATSNEWCLSIQRRGILCRSDQMAKMERLGLLASRDTSVGAKDPAQNFNEMFISQRAFWQLDPRVFLFSISPVTPSLRQICPGPACSLDSLGVGFPFGAGPNTSGTFLPSYYPPQPLQASSSTSDTSPAVGIISPFRIPVLPPGDEAQRMRMSSDSSDYRGGPNLCLDSELANDLKLVYKWVQQRPPDTALPRKESITDQSSFLEDRLSSQNSFPALACWDSSPIGYFELFWVLEDYVGRLLEHPHEFDRGVRCFIGNEDFLKPVHLKRVMSSLVHHCWLYDQRTHAVVFEVRAGNLDVISALGQIGFSQLKEVELPNERNMIMMIHRSDWIAPVL